MKKTFLPIFIFALVSILLYSCNKSEEKYKNLSMQIPLTFATLDVAGRSEITPERFNKYFIEEDFEKTVTQRTDDGIATVYSWKKDGRYNLSEGECFDICAIFDFKHNPEEFTISTVAFKYTSPSSDDLHSFYNTAMTQLEPFLIKWGFERNEKLQKNESHILS